MKNWKIKGIHVVGQNERSVYKFGLTFSKLITIGEIFICTFQASKEGEHCDKFLKVGGYKVKGKPSLASAAGGEGGEGEGEVKVSDSFHLKKENQTCD